jgi:hypothetical protein
VWVRVRGIPYDKRSKETDAYAGSLIGATVEVDEGTLNRTDYVRVKVAVKDETKISAIAKGAIIPFLYNFWYEREVVVDENNPAIPVMVNVDKGPEPSANKKSRTDGQSSHGAQTSKQLQLESGRGDNGKIQMMESLVAILPKLSGGSVSDPLKIALQPVSVVSKVPKEGVVIPKNMAKVILHC